MDPWHQQIEQSKADYMLKRLQELQHVWAYRTMNATVFTSDAAMVWPERRDATEPLVAPDVAAYLADWFAK